jgi:hypothetical protein
MTKILKNEWNELWRHLWPQKQMMEVDVVRISRRVHKPEGWPVSFHKIRKVSSVPFYHFVEINQLKLKNGLWKNM